MSRLHEEVVHALRQPEVRERAVSLASISWDHATGIRDRLEVAKWAEVIRTANIHIE